MDELTRDQLHGVLVHSDKKCPAFMRLDRMTDMPSTVTCKICRGEAKGV